ncbi:hypothetical protein SLEP1_g10548 [Rubroshorea leprosula]|uniref:Uncharacterized protein n=1 Tax=Rubroshorea leprosula TaxID=152421 RepID=A0AAV5IGC6_9ROSI|nr:hypothetical protein SLEP1_g10548 [Rubroshorea leprosula]
MKFLHCSLVVIVNSKADVFIDINSKLKSVTGLNENTDRNRILVVSRKETERRTWNCKFSACCTSSFGIAIHTSDGEDKIFLAMLKTNEIVQQGYCSHHCSCPVQFH